jgi:hypothetical protein
MVELNEFQMAELARELAMNIRTYTTVFAEFGITEEDYYEISKNEFFKRAKEQYALEWNSTTSINDRVRLISSAYAEKTLPTIGKRMMRPDEPLAAVIDGYKVLQKNAGLGEAKGDGPGSSERFVITINLGADTEVYDKSIEINPNDTPPVIEQAVPKPPAPAPTPKPPPPTTPPPPLAAVTLPPKRGRGRPKKVQSNGQINNEGS